MKTFKLYSLSLLEGKDGNVHQKMVPIEDGLIINMENQKQMWYIEAVISQEYKKYFQDVKTQKGHILVDVVITSKDNHPAAMITSVQSITELTDQKISILLEAKLALKKDDIIEDVLKDLVGRGFSNEALVQAFRNEMETLAAHPTSALNTIYRSIQESGLYKLQ
ncbi:YwpF-like family protein [Halalkalibacter alkalisediminis]|uniref:YwpF-like family protein n=1 Tax=Halalkalibacter alkalisediminis TaxID=935616 RepID=A0ABV6NMU2_9BACI|nr:YwpF-like family protein [Halalkalibacter alkalisediminis]